jgi:hypothetical protein
MLTAPGTPGPTIAQAVATFGVAAGAYRHRGYRILVWPRGVNLLAGLRLRWFVLVWRHVIGSPPVWWMAPSRFSAAV